MYNLHHSSKIHSNIPARSVSRRLQTFDVSKYQDLQRAGIYLNKNAIRSRYQYMRGAAMDALQPLVTTPSVNVPIQFLQQWLPGLVNVVTAKRAADQFMGRATIGDWHQSQVVQGVIELLGGVQPYQDYSNVNYASWNTNWIYRNIVRFETGIRIGRLEEAISSEVMVADAAQKRKAAMMILEIERNYVAYNGFNNGASQTYGFLNEPALSAYQNVPNGASGSSSWATKTYLEILKDILTAIVALRAATKDVIDPDELELTLAVASNSVDWLSNAAQYGNTVKDWLQKNYPKIRIVSAPELDNANGGANVFYLYADKVDDDSTDDSATWLQAVPATFIDLGVSVNEKYYSEAFANATAGAMLKRPFAAVRYSGI